MADIVKHRATGVHTAMRKVAKAHEEMTKVLSTHAERHTAELDARRKAARTKQEIEHGIARQNRDVPANSQ